MTVSYMYVWKIFTQNGEIFNPVSEPIAIEKVFTFYDLCVESVALYFEILLCREVRTPKSLLFLDSFYCILVSTADWQ
jgi:hypothetical protein